MKIANHDGRLALVVDGGVIDVHAASDGRFGPDPASAYDAWDDLVTWAADATGEVVPLDEAALGAPSPTPRQVFAIGLNYASHAEESGMDLPAIPAVFTKYPSSLTGPFAPVELSGAMVDWEVELVVVIGREADRVAEADAWDHVAGLTVGQDVSDRHVQFAAGGPVLARQVLPVLRAHRALAGHPRRARRPRGPRAGVLARRRDVQDDRTSGLVFGIPRLIAELSAVCPLLPGDLIFTGTPAGVGIGRTPPRFLVAGEVLESWIEGIGTIRSTVVAGGEPS